MSFEDDFALAARNSLEEAGRQIVAEIRASMPYAPDASKPGTPPHSHSGRLAGSVNSYVVDEGGILTLVVEAFTAYAAYHENGPRPFIAPVVNRWRPALVSRVLTSAAAG